MAEVREAIGFGEWGSQAHFGWDRSATAGSGVEMSVIGQLV
jgi:hypothetical protein